MQPPRNSWPIGSASNAKQPEVITIYKPTSKLDLALFQLSTTIRRFIPYHFARDDFHSKSFELIETVLWNCFLQKFYTLYIYIYIFARLNVRIILEKFEFSYDGTTRGRVLSFGHQQPPRKRALLYYIETMCFCSCTCEFSGAYQFPSRSKCRHRRHVRHERARIAWESKTEKKKKERKRIVREREKASERATGKKRGREKGLEKSQSFQCSRHRAGR